MRKPFYRSSRNAWYHNAKLADGSTKQVFLSRDRDEAFAIFDEHYRPRVADSHRPVGVREVVVIKTVTKTTTRTKSESKLRTAKPEPEPRSSKTEPESKPLPPKPKPIKPPRKQPENDRNRFHSFERVVLIAELLSNLRRGATAGELYHDVIDILGRVYNERTIARDLDFMQQIGVVEAVDTDGHRRYRWNGRSARSVVIERFAESMAG